MSIKCYANLRLFLFFSGLPPQVHSIMDLNPQSCTKGSPSAARGHSNRQCVQGATTCPTHQSASERWSKESVQLSLSTASMELAFDCF